MRDLDQIVRRRALEAIRAANEAEKDGTVDEQVVADRMAEFLGIEEHHNVRKQLRRYLHGSKRKMPDGTVQKVVHKWRIDYLQAFCEATGREPEQLLSLDQGAADVPEATPAQHLYSALGHRLSADQARRLIRVLQQLLDTRPRYELALDLARIVLEAPDQTSALGEVARLVSETKAFSQPRRDLRARRKKRQKV